MVTGVGNHKNNVPVNSRSIYRLRLGAPTRSCAHLQRVSRLLDGEMADLFHRGRHETNLTNNLTCQGPGYAVQAYAAFAAGESRGERGGPL